MTTATIAPFDITASTQPESDPTREFVAWILGSIGAGPLFVPTQTAPVTAKAQVTRPAPKQAPASATLPAAAATSGEHDMTPEYVAWVLGTGYAAGRLVEEAPPARR